MARRYWSGNAGQTEFQMTEGSATVSGNVEVNYDLTQALSKEQVLILLDQIRNVIIKDQWPPA